MKGRLTITALLIMSILCVGCERALDARMTRAESLLDVDPDSAFVLLEGTDWRSISPESRRARFCIDYADAAYRSGMDSGCDTLVRVALAYYDRPGVNDPARLANALFYASQADNSSRATACAMRAVAIADSLGLYGLSGDAWSVLADKYEATSDIRGSIEAYAEASRRYLDAGDTENYQYSEITRAISHVVIPEPEDGIAILDSLTSCGSLEADYLRDYSLLAYAELNSVAGRADIAMQYLDSIPESSTYFGDREIGQYLYVRIPILIALGQLDEAARQLEFLSSTGRDRHDDFLLMKYQYFKAAGQPDSALCYHERMSAQRHEAVMNSMSDNVREVRTTFYSKQINLRDEQNRRVVEHTKMIFGVIFIIVAVVSAVLIIKYRRSRRELRDKTRAIEALKEDASRMNAMMKEMKGNMSDLVKEKAPAEAVDAEAGNLKDQIDFYAEQLSVIDRMLTDYAYDRSLPGNDIPPVLDKYIATVFSGAYFDRLEQGFDRIYSGLFKSLKTEGPELTADERHFLDLLVLGLSSHAVAAVCGISNTYLHTRKSRLRRRIADSAWPRAGELLSLLEKRVKKQNR